MQVTEQLEELVALLPGRNFYTSRRGWDFVLEEDVPVQVSVQARAANDPAFGWVFVRAFLDEGLSMPTEVTDSVLLRTWCWRRYDNGDPQVRRALQLRTRDERTRRVMLHCMLLLEKYTLEHIAGELALETDVVRIYERLFWRVRDRLADKVYINSLVWPDSTQVLWTPDYHLTEDMERMALRAAVSHGMETVLSFLGITSQSPEFSPETHARTLEAQVLGTAVHSARMGLLHQRDAVAVHSGRALVQSSKLGGEVDQDDDARLGLGSLGLGEAVSEHFRKLTEHDVQYRLQLQQNELRKSLEATAAPT